MPLPVHARAVARGAEILGGVAQLSDYLKVPQSEVMRWIKGEEEPTTKAFLDLVDLLLDHDMGEFSHKRWTQGDPTKPR